MWLRGSSSDRLAGEALSLAFLFRQLISLAVMSVRGSSGSQSLTLLSVFGVTGIVSRTTSGRSSFPTASSLVPETAKMLLRLPLADGVPLLWFCSDLANRASSFSFLGTDSSSNWSARLSESPLLSNEKRLLFELPRVALVAELQTGLSPLLYLLANADSLDLTSLFPEPSWGLPTVRE